MATITGTSGDDVIEVTTENDVYDTLAGNDKVTVKGKWNRVQGGAGNDTIIVDPSLKPNEATVWYWSSPNPILVDLEEGYALDGFGTRDTLVNVHTVHGFKQPGDKGYGSSTTDYFYVNAWTGTTLKGSVFIDGRGGEDYVDFYVSETPDRGRFVMEVSADGRSIKAYFEPVPAFTFEFRNIEWFRYMLGSTQTVMSPASIVSFDKAGQDILLRGASGWQLRGPGVATTITYSFLTERPAEGAEDGKGFTAFSSAQQAIVRDIFAKLQQQTGLTFREVAGSNGDIRLGINQQSDTRGYSFIPDFFRGKAEAGDVWLDVESAAVMNPGQEGYYALLHELGHALGLQHPLGESDTSGSVVLLDRFASLSNTVMIDRTREQTGGLWPTWFGAMDMQALRFLYGNQSVSTGSDRYMAADMALKGYALILDDGGDDTLDASTSSIGVTLDLRQGWLSSVGVSAEGAPHKDNVSIGVGSVIESAVGSAYDDLIVGSDGPNRIQGNGGSDIIDGNGGLDWAVFKGARAGWIVEPLTGTVSWFVTSRDGSGGMAELRRVERLRFDDKAVAFDLTKNDNAGKALLLIGAVIGREATLSKAPLLGQVIDFFDQGFTMQQLAGAVMRLPIWAGVLTPTNSAEDIARYLLKLNKGAEPTAAEVSTAAQAISGQVQGNYLATLAMTDANVTKIDLVGLATTGFEYPIGG